MTIILKSDKKRMRHIACGCIDKQISLTDEELKGVDSKLFEKLVLRQKCMFEECSERGEYPHSKCSMWICKSDLIKYTSVVMLLIGQWRVPSKTKKLS